MTRAAASRILTGAGEFMANYVIGCRQGKKARPVKHLYGRSLLCAGRPTARRRCGLPNGATRSFEWGPKALCAVTAQCQYKIFKNPD